MKLNHFIMICVNIYHLVQFSYGFRKENAIKSNRDLMGATDPK